MHLTAASTLWKVFIREGIPAPICGKSNIPHGLTWQKQQTAACDLGKTQTS